MKILLKTLLLAGLAAAAVAAPAAARGPGMGWGAGPGPGLNPDCPRFEQSMDETTATLPARPMMMRRMPSTDGTTWTCPRFGDGPAADQGAKVPGVRDGTGPWWRQVAPENAD